MLSNITAIVTCLILSIIALPAFAHPGHTSAPHIHNIAEFALLGVVICLVLYRLIKK